MVSTTTLARINDIGDAESNAHCQKGQQEIVYDVIRLIPTSTSIRIKKNKSRIQKKTQLRRQKRTRRRSNPRSEYSAGGRNKMQKTRRVKKS